MDNSARIYFAGHRGLVGSALVRRCRGLEPTNEWYAIAKLEARWVGARESTFTRDSSRRTAGTCP